MTLLPQHTNQLDASAISAAIRRERGYWSAADPAEWARRDGDMADYQCRLPGLAYPVYRLGTAKPYTMMLRPDEPRVEKRDGGKERPVKYEWPAGKALCIDILPRYRDSLRDPAIPIWFTEGAKKADALSSLGKSIIPASLNGVWCWRHKTADADSVPLADFDDLALKGREAVLAFDSDQAVNENVRQALDAFAAFLSERGALVSILKLPHGEQKLGVDDAIAAGWTFEQLTEAIEPYAHDPRPRIKVRDLDIPEIVAPAWDALIATNEPPTLFRRDGTLYELTRDDEGAAVLSEVDKRRLRSRLARVALFVEERVKRGAPISWIVEPPSSILDDMLVRVDSRIPLITRITRCPVVGANGSIIDTPGYHPTARIYYDPRPGPVVPPIPAQPTAEDIAAARRLVLDDLLGEFPFVEKADRAHAVALFLLPFVREAIPGPTPLHVIEAPTPGSGKSLLASVLTRPALGVEATPITEGKDDADWQKKLTSVLARTPAAVLIDNVNRPLYGSALAAALTATVYSERLLGTNSMTAFPIHCAWMATANNPTMSGEIARRAIRIRIDPQVDQPWQRDGFKHPNLIAWTREHEGALVAAALTLIRAGLTTDAPPLKPLGSFEHWTVTMGRILHAAGIPDFLGNLDELYDRADTEGAAWRALVNAWWETHRDAVVSGGEVFEVFKAGDYELNLDGRDEKAQRVSFGKRLKKQQDRVIGGYQVVNAGTKQRAQQWQLRPMKSQPVKVSEGCEDNEGLHTPPTHVHEYEEEITPKNTEYETFTTLTTFTQPLTPADTLRVVPRRPPNVNDLRRREEAELAVIAAQFPDEEDYDHDR